MNKNTYLDVMDEITSTLPPKEIGKEKWVQLINEKIKSDEFSYDDTMLTELKNMTNYYTFTLKSNLTIKSKGDYNKMQDFHARIMADISRITQIKLGMRELKSALEDLQNMGNLVLWNYAAVKSLKNDDMRKALYSLIIPDMFDKLRNIDLTLEMCGDLELMVKQFGFSTNSIFDLSEKHREYNT